ncbi:MAG TPA: serine/threonine-protein kinase, partial [Allocoleopsis sp.]
MDNTVFQQDQNTAIINTQKTQLEVTKIYITCSQEHQNISTNNFCIDCGERLLKPSSLFTSNYPHKILTEGDILKEQYRIIKKIGLGGFGNTYLAEDLNLPSRRQCVVKELKYQDGNIIRLFEREARILEELGEKTKQIPKLYAYFQENYNFYLVQDYINGITLDQEICTGNKMSELAVINFLNEMLKILDIVHKNYIVHRDIKPGNIMRKVEGDLVLIDFGIAKQISNIQNQGANLTKVYTPGYAPPEQLIGHVYFNSDIYALGMVCIQALTGLSAEDLFYYGVYHIIQEYIKNIGISEKFAQILKKMIAYNWQERYQKASDVLIDFSKLL